MNIVALERNSAGTDISVDCWNELGNVTCYRNTVTVEEVQAKKIAGYEKAYEDVFATKYTSGDFDVIAVD